jgi:osmoprotectant transport system substrate-binding protein
VTRADFDKSHPEVLEVVKPLADALDTETMTQLNKKISSDGLPADKIAEDYLKEKGFIK